MPIAPNAGKTLSLAGLDMIKHAEEEGGKPKLKAYDDGTGTWSIAWGCTEGVYEGMTCTVQEAIDMLDAELKKHIASVHRLIKRPVSQGLFDAMVSFFFNHGAGNCPTIIRAVNTGTEDQIRAAFMLYTKAYDKKLGKKVTWPGLVNRRTIELQHWAKMDELDPHVQTPEAPRTPPPAEPPQPSAVTEAAKSKSVWMLAVTAIGWIVDQVAGLGAWVGGLLSGATSVMREFQSSADDLVSPLIDLTTKLNLNLGRVGIWLTIGVLGVVLFRHTGDKVQIASMAAGQSESDA